MATATSQPQRTYRTWILAGALAATGFAAWGVMRVLREQKAEWVVPEFAINMKNPSVASPAEFESTKSTYENHCARCHGENGKGNGPDANLYAPPPQDFSNLKTKGASDGELFWKISEGRRPMPGFKNDLSEEMRWQLVNYLRVLATPTIRQANPGNGGPSE